jgi:hypothetical protein
MVPRTETVLGFLRRWAAVGYDRSADYLPVFADALEEAGYSCHRTLATLRGLTDERGRPSRYLDEDEFREALAGVPPELAGSDWREAFAYAGEQKYGEDDYGCYGQPNLRMASDHLPAVPLTPFARRDVARVVAQQDGENDGPDWVCVGELRDGRFFALRAGCDYTGWD